MKKGFTLVELLAVIVILSVIAIITVPIIGNVIEESKKKALEQSAYGLVEAADYYALENEGEYSFLFDNDHKGENIDKTKQLEYKGSIEGEGKLYIDNNGDVSLCINSGKYYAYKNYDSGIVIGNISDNGECNVKKIGNHYVAYLENEGEPTLGINREEIVSILQESLNDYATKAELNSLSTIVSNITIQNNVIYNDSTDSLDVYFNGSQVGSLPCGFQSIDFMSSNSSDWITSGTNPSFSKTTTSIKFTNNDRTPASGAIAYFTYKDRITISSNSRLILAGSNALHDVAKVYLQFSVDGSTWTDIATATAQNGAQISETIDLSNFAGSSVYLRIKVGSSGSVVANVELTQFTIAH